MECLYVTNFMPRSQCLFASGFTSIASTFIALTLMVGHQSGTVLQRPAFEIIYAVGPIFCLQCFDAVGWAAGRASGL